MAEITKTSEQMEDIFRLMVLKILGLDPEAEENQDRIRFPWGSNLGNPDNGFAELEDKTKDVCIITILPKDDLYNRQRNRRYEDRGGRDLTAIDEHTDVHEVTFCNYGANAYEYTRKIRDALFEPKTKRFLLKNHFALVADVPAIRRIPELFNGEWWNRCDFTAVFNEFVCLEDTVGTIEEININVKTVMNGGEISKEITVNRKDLQN